MLPLRAPPTALRDDRPAVLQGPDDLGRAALDQDRLDCKRHARAKLERITVGHVENIGSHMEFPANEMATKLRNYTISTGNAEVPGEATERVQLNTRPHLRHRGVQTLLRDIHQAPRLRVHL